MKGLLILALFALPLPAQAPTARDTAHARVDSILYRAFRNETNRPHNLNPRRTVINQLADSLYRSSRRLIAPMAPPPDTTPPPPPNGAPTASFSKSYDPTMKTVAVNAGASTDDKGITAYQWQFGDGASGTGVTATHRYSASGTFNISLTVRDAEGLASTTTQQQTVATDSVIQPPPDTVVVPPPDSGSLATPPELPRSVPAFTIPAPTRVITVAPPMDLQAVFDNAQRGDELRLAANYTGNFAIRSCGPGWIIVSGTATLPAVGTRVTPAMAASYAKISTPNTAPALFTEGPACRWAFRGLEVIGQLETMESLAYGIIRFGRGGDEGQTTLASVPFDFVLSHSYVHGLPQHNNTRCVVLNSANSIIRDSWLSECHARGSDSQAILIWNSPGPFLIENNRLEGAGENFMSGGADPGISGLIPSDITVRGNHVIKPLAWKGGPWSIKNLFELKNARRILVENNVFENSWPASQEGMAIVIKSSQDNCGTCTWQGSTDLTFRWNIVRSAAVGLNLQAVDGSGQVAVTNLVKRVAVTDNLFEKIGPEGRSALMMFTHPLTDILVARNTMLHNANTSGLSLIFAYSEGRMQRLAFTANLLTATAGYAIFNDGGPLHGAALTAVAGSTWTFTGNVVAGISSDFTHLYPPGNQYPASVPTTSTAGVNMVELGRRTAGVVVSP